MLFIYNRFLDSFDIFDELNHGRFLQVWEFDEAHNRWLPVAELALPEDRSDEVYAVAWALNICR